ncbi:hypothetical protein [Fervidobacterium sp. 2310opik-2]|uniref:hypothetical protein n=1 Tax=Fervidobacterium sp. 2310opik-2 TaxID=1755815 RepID=UPI0013E01C9F|nr:hypothetical protein [Fervidobacterium sp. 2310opik-2]KAF2961316.1 hypothetical protein AS161_01865 [Fervidobacterium sp. 2310opik-2]
MEQRKLHEKSKKKEKFLSHTQNIEFTKSEEEDFQETTFEEETEDTSERGLKNLENIEFNPEVDIISKRKIGFQIVKVKDGDIYEYELINFTNNNRAYEELKKILKTFPWFENIKKERLYALASDKRTAKSNIIISKELTFNYSIKLPNGDVMPISSLKPPKGRFENIDLEINREFRVNFIYENHHYINSLKKGSLGKFENIEEFIGEFLIAIANFSGKSDNWTREKFREIKEYFDKSSIVRDTLQEYMKFFQEV